MRQTQEIRALTGGRYLIILEDGSSFPLYGKEVNAFAIREGKMLCDADYENIMQELLPKRAKLCAMHFLQKMDRTEQQLRRKLSTLFYPEEIIEQAVTYVKGYRYIDDERYAVSYIEYRKDRKSVRQMEQELLGKGISKEIFQQALLQIEKPDEDRQIRYWLEKKHYADVRSDLKERERIFRFLLRKGYSASSVRSAMQIDE